MVIKKNRVAKQENINGCFVIWTQAGTCSSQKRVYISSVFIEIFELFENLVALINEF